MPQYYPHAKEYQHELFPDLGRKKKRRWLPAIILAVALGLGAAYGALSATPQHDISCI